MSNEDLKRKRKSSYVSNEQALLNYEIIFTNVENQPLIKEQLEEYEYNAAKISEGKSLYQAARNAYNSNRSEEAQLRQSRKIFDTQAEVFFTLFTKHRKDTKVWFRNEPQLIKQLGIFGPEPAAFAARIEEANTFYLVLLENQAILPQLAKFKITPETIENSLNELAKVRQARVDYLCEKGESQQATQAKDAAFRAIEAWLKDFFAIARIALEDNPQLLEALTKLVRS